MALLQVNMGIWTPHYIKWNNSYHSLNTVIHTYEVLNYGYIPHKRFYSNAPYRRYYNYTPHRKSMAMSDSDYEAYE